MAWRIIKQPNGLFGRFSDVVDSFTHINLSDDQVIHMCMYEYDCGPITAARKLQAATEDWKPWKDGVKGSGHDRWDDAIKTIRDIHGEDHLNELLHEIANGK